MGLTLGAEGNIQPEHFFADLHKPSQEGAAYLRLVHEWSSLHTTSNHLVFVSEGIFRQPVAIPAGRLKNGYRLLAHVPGQLGGLVQSTVIQILRVWDLGFHAPLTYSGKLVVEGIL